MPRTAGPAPGQHTPRAHRFARLPLLAGGLLALLLVTAMLGGCLNLGERLFYYPMRDAFVTPPDVHDVEFATDDALTLHGWFMPARDAAPGQSRPAILHVHGNAGHVALHGGFSDFLRDHGFHVLLFDYRGYGRSDPGRPTRAALVRDTAAALAYLKARPDVDPSRIGLFGQSLGAAFALPVAADDPAVRSVVALSAFSTWRGVAGDHAPLIGHLLVGRGREPELDAARLGHKPLLIVHGDADTIVRPRHAHRLHAAAQAAGVPVELVVIPAADHNGIIDASPEARRAIADFFTRTLAPAETAP